MAHGDRHPAHGALIWRLLELTICTLQPSLRQCTIGGFKPGRGVSGTGGPSVVKKHGLTAMLSKQAQPTSHEQLYGTSIIRWHPMWRVMTRHAAACRRFPLTDRTWVSNRINQRPDQLLLPLRCAMMRHLSCAYPTSGCNYVKGGAAQRCRLGGSRLRLGAQEGRRRVRVASSDKNDQNQLGDDLLGETLLQDPCMSTYR